MLPHEPRGLRIDGTNFSYLSEGAYAVIFVDREQGRVRKIYLASKSIDHCSAVFNAEIDAYRKANAADDLKPLVPAFYGTVLCQKIVDKDGSDVTAEFHPQLSFESEYIPHRFEKVAIASDEERNRVTALFRKHGIQHLTDISFWIDQGVIQKVIDFAIREVECVWK